MISFVETVYSASESNGFVEVCVEQIERSVEENYKIIENVIFPEIFDEPSSVYIPNGAVFAS